VILSFHCEINTDSWFWGFRRTCEANLVKTFWNSLWVTSSLFKRTRTNKRIGCIHTHIWLFGCSHDHWRWDPTVNSETSPVNCFAYSAKSPKLGNTHYVTRLRVLSLNPYAVLMNVGKINWTAPERGFCSCLYTCTVTLLTVPSWNSAHCYCFGGVFVATIKIGTSFNSCGHGYSHAIFIIIL
jgi:hypothetical protein